MVMNLLWVTIFSWIISLSWACYLWGTQGYERAYELLMDTTAQQAILLAPFRIDAIHLPALNDSDLLSDQPPLINTFYIQGERLFQLMIASLELMLTKLSALLAALPLFLLAMMSGLIDGLSQRAIRTACLGRESTYVFHKSTRWIAGGFLSVLGLWLSLPLSIAPSAIFLSMSVLLGWVVSISACRFKKYL